MTVNSNHLETSNLNGTVVYFSDNKKQKLNVEMLIPVKAIKGQPERERQSRKTYNELFSTAVSKVRQPIESFFSLLNKNTTIQRAQK